MAIESMNAASVATSVQPQASQQTQQTQQTQEAQQAKQAQQALEVKQQQAEQSAKLEQSVKQNEKVSAEQLEAAIERLNQLMQEGQRSLAFSVDKDLEEVIITVKDMQTDQIIRQIPNEEALKFAKNLESVLGVIFNDRA